MKRLEIVTLAILIGSFVMPGVVVATKYAVGVKAGDWMKYGRFRFVWTRNGTEPSYITDERKVAWVKTEVINVDGSIITASEALHYNNGTEVLSNITEDMSGSNQITLSAFVIASNLKSGDQITPQPNSATINQTVTRIYGSASRTVNMLNFSTAYQNQTITSTFYFDQKTGFMVEMYTKSPLLERDLRATETDMWSPDLGGLLFTNQIYLGMDSITIISIAIATLFLIIEVDVRKRRHQGPR